MATISEVRQKYPQYKDLSDEQLAGALHQKFYSDMSFEDFSKKIGYSAKAPSDGYPADFPRHQPTDTTGQWWKKELQAMTYPQTWGRQAKLAGRSVIDAAQALPMMAMDMGVSGRNMLTGSNYQLPSQMSRESLNTVLPEATTPQEKTATFIETVLAGGKMPAPQAAKQAPAGFVKPAQDLVRQQTLAASQKAGYVVPPTTTNPTMSNRFMESIGGKIGTAQEAALRNQSTTNTLAKRAVGLNEDAPLTLEALKATRSDAGKAYEVVRGVSSTSLDETSTKALDAVSAKFAGSKLKDALGGGNDIPKIVQAIKDEPLNGDTAVDSMALLRDKADEAYRAGKNELGKAYKSISKTIEDLMERQLSGDALKNFREARTLIAKTHSVEGALNQSTGNVVATKLATQLGKGKPLSGDLKTAAQFGGAFPKAAQEVVDSGSVRNTDVILGSGAALMEKQPWYLMYPFLRQGARSYLLSGRGQANAVPEQFKGIPPELAMRLLAGEESLRQK
jgi:hypothetical protein